MAHIYYETEEAAREKLVALGYGQYRIERYVSVDGSMYAEIGEFEGRGYYIRLTPTNRPRSIAGAP